MVAKLVDANLNPIRNGKCLSVNDVRKNNGHICTEATDRVNIKDMFKNDSNRAIKDILPKNFRINPLFSSPKNKA